METAALAASPPAGCRLHGPAHLCHARCVYTAPTQRHTKPPRRSVICHFISQRVTTRTKLELQVGRSRKNWSNLPLRVPSWQQVRATRSTHAGSLPHRQARQPTATPLPAAARLHQSGALHRCVDATTAWPEPCTRHTAPPAASMPCVEPTCAVPWRVAESASVLVNAALTSGTSRAILR